MNQNKKQTAPLKECQAVGCTNLSTSVYCPVCKKEGAKSKQSEYVREEEIKKFYASYFWGVTAKDYKIGHPLCARCTREGRTTKVQLVHHKVFLRELLDRKENPYSWEWLEGLCRPCHDKEHEHDVKKGQTKKIEQGAGVPNDLKKYLY